LRATNASWTVPSTAERIRLDQFLRRLLPDQSRSQIQIWIRSGHVRLNGFQVKTGRHLKPGDEITLELPPAAPDMLLPEDLPLCLIHEDDDLAVVEKAAGMICHPGAGVRSGTLVNALLFHLGPLEAGDPARPGIVHRLDKFTSGLLVVAKNNPAHRCLALQFKNRQVVKEYLALVHGVPKLRSGTISMPLGRDPRNRKRISVRARRRRAAITHYTVEREYGRFALLRVRIETGRTHQIRVHLSQIKHPIVGDTLYGGVCSHGQRTNLPGHRLGRPFLHAHRLEFHHPRTGERLSFTSPLPQELSVFLALL
jgi:23S rRNA pseudouridine1911/1915/1917 synthase